MKKYEISPDDQKIMDRDMVTNRTLKHLKNKSIYKFSVGDVLLKEDKYGNEWRVHTASCGLAYKYVYVFENELNIGYIRRLSIKGDNFVGAPTCVLEFDPETTRFIPDPEFADHVLFGDEGEEFDSQSRYANLKKRREQINRKNKKMAIKFESAQQAIDWIKTLKVGDSFYYADSIGYPNKELIYVTSINMDVDPYRCHITYSTNPTVQGYRMTAGNMQHKYFFKEKPFFVEDVIN